MIGLASGPLTPFSDERSRSFHIVRIVRPFERSSKGRLSGQFVNIVGRVIRAHQNEGPIEEWGKWSTYSPFSRRTSSARVLREVIGAFNPYESDWTSFPYLYAEVLLISIRYEISP